MSLSRTFSPVLHFEDGKGHPLAGGWLCTYLAGTNTPVATFRNGSGTLNPTQIQLDSRGECEVWLDASIRYKFALYDSTKTTPIWVKDDITAPGVVVMPDTKEVYVVGTSPVLVTAVTLNGITTYTVALDSTFTQAVSNNTQAIANEITRAQNAESGLNTAIGNEVTRATGKENELGTAITNEVTRATAAEKAAKTEVKAGDNIEVSKSTGADGHNIYTIKGVESVPNVEITSPNNTISVSSSEDQQTNTKTFSIDVKEKPLSLAWVESVNMTYSPNTSKLYTNVYSLLDLNWQNPQGDKITYDPNTSKLWLAKGYYTIFSRLEITWEGTPQNKTISVGGNPFDLSFNHKASVGISALHQISATTAITITVDVSEQPPQGFTVKVKRADIYSVQQVMENVVQGLESVITDDTLTGDGTSENPLSVVVDDALNADSENPVQNKVLYGIIGDVESLLGDL